MFVNRLTRRDVLISMATGGIGLFWNDNSALGQKGDMPRYPTDRSLANLRQAGWVIEYKRTDVRGEGLGLRCPSLMPPQDYVIAPAIIESQFKADGTNNLLMPSFASVGDQTCLVTRVEVEVDGKLLRRNRDYFVKPLVTRPLGNRFWQISGIKTTQKTLVKVRVIGILSSPPAPAKLAAAKELMAKTAARANQFEKKYRVVPLPHYLKNPSKELLQALAAVSPRQKSNRFADLYQILLQTQKKGKLDLKARDRDPEKFVEDGMKGACGAHGEFVNLAASRAGHPYLFYTEGFVVVPRLNYLGMHAWNLACCNGFFIADSLHPDLYFPSYSGYVATSVGPNLGHPAGANGATNAGWVTGTAFSDYFVYFSMPGFGLHGDMLKKMPIPEPINQLGLHVAGLRKKVNQR